MSAQAIPLKGSRVFLYFLLFFVSISAVDAIMVTYALRTRSGVVTDHPYEKGLAYNAVVQAETEQEKWGWKGEITLVHNQLSFLLQDASHHPVKVNSAKAVFSRPTQAGNDFEVELKEGAASIHAPMSGLWEVRVFAKVGDKTYQQAKRVELE